MKGRRRKQILCVLLALCMTLGNFSEIGGVLQVQAEETVSSPNVAQSRATEDTTLPIELDFNEETVGSTPTGWVMNPNATNGAEKGSMLVEADGDNKIVKLKQTGTVADYHYQMHYSFEAVDKAVLEYKFKATTQTMWGYLPMFCYDDPTTNKPGSPIYLVLRAGKLKYSVDNGTWQDAKEGLGDSNWHTVKLEVDLKNNVRVLSVDGTQIELNQTHMDTKPCDSTQTLTSIKAGFLKDETNGEFFIDDVKIYLDSISTEEPVIDLEIPIELDFEDETVDATPTGWVMNPNATNGAEKGSMLVEADGENKIVKLKQTGTVADYHYQMHYSFEAVDKAVLEYKFKATSQTMWGYLPMFCYDDPTNNKPGSPLYLLLRAGKLKYSVDNSNWQDAVTTLDADSWHTVKLEVDLKNNVRELYVDGSKIELAQSHMTTKACDSTQTLTSIKVGFLKDETNGEFFIDDIKISEYTALNPNPTPDPDPAPEPTVIPEIPFEINFNDVEAEATPAGWTVNPKTNGTGASMVAVADSSSAENKYIKLEQPNAYTWHYLMQYKFKEASQAVLEYRFMSDGSANYVYLPALTYNDDRPQQPLYLMLVNGGTQVQYSVNNAKWKNAAAVSTDQWHTLKLIVDLTNNVRELYIDGQRIEMDAEHMETQGCDSSKKLVSVMNGFLNSATNSCFYMDDIKVSDFVAGESVSFDPAEYTIPKKGSITLTPVFTPANTTMQGMTYTSENPEIATVDASGVVTGVADGTTTITATPHLDLEPVTINITVEGSLTGSITVEKDEISLPVGGHTFANATLSFNGYQGDTSLAYGSADADIATVDEWGEIVAVSAGTTKITIESVVNPEITKEISVTVTEASVQQTIYVSPNGTGDGTSATSATTLAGALTTLAGIDKANMTGNIEVILADGYYRQSETLKLTEAHGGNNLYTVVFKAAEGAEPVIGGGIKIVGSSFTESNIEGVYVANVDANVQTRQLYVNNVRATRARSEGTLKNPELLYDSTTGKNIGIVCDNTELLDYTNADGLEFVYSSYWIQSRAGVKEIKAGTDGRVQLIMDQPGWQWAQEPDVATVKFTIEKIDYYENALELLDEPGEWYLDETANKLYYMPRTWENMSSAEFTIPTLDAWDQNRTLADNKTGESGLLMVAGSNYDNMVQNIRFEGITFADVTWMRPSSDNGHIINQNNYIRDGQRGASVYTADAAITVTKANSVSFIDCDFTRIGTIALRMTEGVQNSHVIGNHFMDISGNAIQIGEGNYTHNVDNYNPSDIRKLMKNCDVLNNYIHDIGVDFYSSAAIGVGFAADLDLCRNEIFNIPYSAFHIGYGWNTVFDNVLKNMNISNNFIHDYMHTGIFDGGGIYVLGNTAGNNAIRENYVRNQGANFGVLYFDNGSTNWTAEGNVLDSSETPLDPLTQAEIPWLWVNTPSNNITVKNNYHTSTFWRTNGEDITNLVVEDNPTVSDANWPEGAKTVINKSGLSDSYAGLRNGQAERVFTNLPEEEIIGMKANETMQIQVSSTDGKDRTIDLSNAIVAYDILDDSVATVSNSGLVTAKQSGETKLRVYVVSNDIQTVIERKIYVDDSLQSIALKEIDGDISLYTVPGTKVTLQPYGVTTRGRELDLTDVTYTVADTKIASVSADGILKPVGAGQTTVTVTGTAEGQTKSATYTVVVNSAGEVSYLDDIFEKDNEDKWIGTNVTTGTPVAPTTWELKDEESITTFLNGYRTYTGKAYGDELLTFYLSIDRQNTWPSFYFRAQDTDKAVGLGATGYIVCFTDDGMQLQRFNGGDRTVIYGTVGDIEGIVAPNVKPCALDDKQLHKIQVAAVNEEGSVRLLMYIDGEMIFNYLDTAENAIKEAGYFGLVGRSALGVADKFMLVKASEEAEPVEIVASASDGSYTLGSQNTVTIYCTGELDELLNVKMDGNIVDADCYELEEGSTVLKFKPAYLETLTEGTHKVTMEYTYGRIAEAELKIVKTSTGGEKPGDSQGSGTGNKPGDSQGTDTGANAGAETQKTDSKKPVEVYHANQKGDVQSGSPSTGDGSNAGLWIAVAVVAALGITAGYFVKKKSKSSEE